MSHPHRSIRTAVIRWGCITLVLGVCLSLLLAWGVRRDNERRAQASFAALSAQVVDRLGKRLQLYEYGLRGVRGAVAVVGDRHLTREAFRVYANTRDIDREFPGARGFGFIRHVPADQVEAFVQQARADGAPDFTIHQLGTHSGDRYVIQYIEPVERNRPAVGLDVGSEANRRGAAILSMRTGKAVMTGPIKLVQKSGDPMHSVLFMLPIYRPGMPLNTEAERERACAGWSYAALSLEEVLADFQLVGSAFGMALFDVTEERPRGGAAGSTHAPVLFASKPQAMPGGLAQTRLLEQYGRRWRVELREQPAFREQIPQNNPVLVFFVSVLVSGLLAAIVGIVTVGRQRQRVAALQKAQLATIVENSADAIIGESMNGTIISWNRAAERLFGRTEAEVIGQPLAELMLPPSRRHEDADVLSRIGRGEVLPPFDSTRLHKDGTEIDVSVTAGAMYGPNRKLIGVAKLMRDIRERKEAERRLQEFAADLERQVEERTAELQQAKTAAEAANQAKSMFLSNMSHEIRTPMNAVIGAAHLLESTALDEDQRQLLGKVQLAGRSLLAIINDVLDLGKIEAGEMQLESRPFDPRHVLGEVIELFSAQASDKGIRLEVSDVDGLPAVLRGDGLRVQQILVNLVGNAIKFTHRGWVHLSVAVEGQEGSAAWLRWSVQDTGIGIPPDALARLFTPFTQADASTTRRFGGTGLGLSIVQQLSRLMGGEVGASSSPGRGSEFWVRLPFEVVQAAPAPADAAGPGMREGVPVGPQSAQPEAGGLQGLHILLVDDSEINLEIGSRLLAREGATVETCVDGHQALMALRSKPFDAVLMDIQMPVMDGYEATRRIRTELGLVDLPVLALTAGALSEERGRAEAAGMDDFLTKPLDPSAMVAHLRRVVAARRRERDWRHAS